MRRDIFTIGFVALYSVVASLFIYRGWIPDHGGFLVLTGVVPAGVVLAARRGSRGSKLLWAGATLVAFFFVFLAVGWALMSMIQV